MYLHKNGPFARKIHLEILLLGFRKTCQFFVGIFNDLKKFKLELS